MSLNAKRSFEKCPELPNSHRIDPRIYCRACEGQCRSPHPHSIVLPAKAQITRPNNLQNADNTHWHGKDHC